MPPAPTREDTWLIGVTIFPPSSQPFTLGVFDTFEGGEVDSSDEKYRPGGMGAEISLGGTKTIGDVTVGRYFDIYRDWPMFKTLTALAGVARMSVGRTPLFPNGLSAGETATWVGTLKTVTAPDVDSTSSDVALLELEMTCDGNIG